MEKEPSSFEKKLIRIKESGFWDAFRFTKDGHFKSTLLIYSFSLSFVFIAVYIACYWLLIDPIEFGLRGVLSTRLLTLAESVLPAVLGTLVCSVFHFISHEKKMVLFTYGWLVVYLVILWAYSFVTFNAEEFTVVAMLAKRFLAPPMITGIAWALLLYLRHRANDPFKKYQSLPDWQKRV